MLSEENEITKFLAMPMALEVENPLEWWRKNAQFFLNLLASIWLYLLLLLQVNAYFPMLETLFLLLEDMKVMEVFTPDWNNLEDNDNELEIM